MQIEVRKDCQYCKSASWNWLNNWNLLQIPMHQWGHESIHSYRPNQSLQCLLGSELVPFYCINSNKPSLKMPPRNHLSCNILIISECLSFMQRIKLMSCLSFLIDFINAAEHWNENLYLHSGIAHYALTGASDTAFSIANAPKISKKNPMIHVRLAMYACITYYKHKKTSEHLMMLPMVIL